MRERRRKRADKSAVNTSVAHEDSEHQRFEVVSRNTTQGTEDAQRPSVTTSDGPWSRTVTTGRVFRQYQRRRIVETATSEHDGVVSRLGIASNLL